MNHHLIKISPEHYNNVLAGTKTFEIRENDRAYQKGDLVTLHYFPREWSSCKMTVDGIKCDDDTRLPLAFRIGDVYPIDDKRVVFSLLKIEGEK